MRELTIIRHGEAVPHGTPGIPDDDRHLTPQGERKFRQAARGLESLGLEPDRIVTSPLPRARRTAELLAEALDMVDRLEIDLALSAERQAADIARWAEARPEDRLVIVGHNPWCSELLALLLGLTRGPGFEMTKGGAALLIRHEAAFELRWLATQKILRKLR